MNSLTLLPPDLRLAFARAPHDVKRSFRQRCDALARIDAAKQITAEVRKQAALLGMSEKTLRNLRSRVKQQGWAALLDIRALPELWKTNERVAMHPDFIAHFKKLCGDNKRGTNAAIEDLYRQLRLWRRGDLSQAIPGYTTPPEGKRPLGWSKRNLERYKPSKFELKAARRGLSHAIGACGPQTFSTRKTLHLHSHIMIDDVLHDNFVVFGKRGICRVLELDGLDVFSGALVFWGTKPRLERADGTMDSALKKFVPLCLAGVFSNEGYSPRGTIILAEHGTAQVSEDVKRILYDYSGHKITVRESGMTGEEQAIVGWRGMSKGNSRFKAALESHHSLKHNMLGAVPAQAGLDRDTRPEFTHGMLEDDADLIKAIAVLAKNNPARANQLRFRLLDYHSAFVPLLMEVYQAINGRDWHNLEGWDEIPGNVQIVHRLAPDDKAPWLSPDEFAALPAAVQANVIAAAAQDKRYIDRRRLSPAEVQQRDRGELVKLPDFAVAELIGMEFARELKVAGAYFNLFSDEEIAPEPLRYESVVTDIEGRECQLPDDKYTVVPNPFDPSRIYVFDAGNRFLGTARRETRVNRFDEDQLRAAWGRQAHRVKELTAPLVQRHAADIRAETARLKHNADVLASTPENELERLVAKADPVKDQLRRSAKVAEAPAQEERYDS